MNVTDERTYVCAEETGLIEEAWWSGIVEPGAEWHALRHAGAAAALAYRVRVTCQPNYYNATCTTFCRPRDDKFGHYTCSAQGDKHCLPGWQGDNCEKREYPPPTRYIRVALREPRLHLTVAFSCSCLQGGLPSNPRPL